MKFGRGVVLTLIKVRPYENPPLFTSKPSLSAQFREPICIPIGSPCFLPLQTPPAHLPAPPDHAPLEQDHHCPSTLPPSAQRVTIQTSPTSLNSTSRPADILPAPMRGQGTEACFGKRPLHAERIKMKESCDCVCHCTGRDRLSCGV